MRRLKYKVKARDPDRAMFRAIFQGACVSYRVLLDDEGFEYLVDEHYVKTRCPFRGVHPRDLLDQLVTLACYIVEPPHLSSSLLDSEVDTYFIAKA